MEGKLTGSTWLARWLQLTARRTNRNVNARIMTRTAAAIPNGPTALTATRNGISNSSECRSGYFFSFFTGASLRFDENYEIIFKL